MPGIGIVFFALISISFILKITFVAYWLMDGHSWHYRNPYNRKCKKCGRLEVSHCKTMGTWGRSWWEAFNDGDSSKHPHHKLKLYTSCFIGFITYVLIAYLMIYQ